MKGRVGIIAVIALVCLAGGCGGIPVGFADKTVTLGEVVSPDGKVRAYIVSEQTWRKWATIVGPIEDLRIETSFVCWRGPKDEQLRRVKLPRRTAGWWELPAARHDSDAASDGEGTTLLRFSPNSALLAVAQADGITTVDPVTGDSWVVSRPGEMIGSFRWLDNAQIGYTARTGKDEAYAYDRLNRLDTFHRGDWDGDDIPTGDRSHSQEWGLTPTGNWGTYKVDNNGDEDFTDAGDLDQDRTHSLANELTGITEQSSPYQQTQWADPVQDARGNMTTVPKPVNLTEAYTCTYDAWNRLVTVYDEEAEETIAQYEYDGLNRRVKKHIDSAAPDEPDGVDTYRHFYYNTSWQVLETRSTTSSENTAPDTLAPEHQYVWSARYIDAPVLRDANDDGTTDDACDDEQLYYLTDASMNVTALVDDNATVVERYSYDPYGNVAVYDGSWSSRGSSSYDNAILFGGYFRDAETGLYHVRNRMYQANLGRWLQRDPAGYPDGLNRYQYVAGRPISGLDPMGLADPDTNDPFDIHSSAYWNIVMLIIRDRAPAKYNKLRDEGIAIKCYDPGKATAKWEQLETDDQHEKGEFYDTPLPPIRGYYSAGKTLYLKDEFRDHEVAAITVVHELHHYQERLKATTAANKLLNEAQELLDKAKDAEPKAKTKLECEAAKLQSEAQDVLNKRRDRSFEEEIDAHLEEVKLIKNLPNPSRAQVKDIKAQLRKALSKEPIYGKRRRLKGIEHSEPPWEAVGPKDYVRRPRK